MIKKIFLFLIACISILKSVDGQEEFCDNLIFDYLVLFDRVNEHRISSGNIYHYSVNNESKKQLTVTNDVLIDNGFKIPRIDLNKGENNVRIYSNGIVIKNIELVYHNPSLVISGLSPKNYIDETDVYLLKSTSKLSFSVKESESRCDKWGDVNMVEIFLNDNKYAEDTILESQIAEGAVVSLNLKWGFNVVRFKIYGKFDPDILRKISDYNEVNYEELKVFCFGTGDLPAVFKNGKICLTNKDVKLNGIPEGGYFTGPGINGKTCFFNPVSAGVGIHELKYVYIFNGNIIESNPIQVEVEPDYNFSISGPQVVCINSTCVSYKLNGSKFEDYNFQWDIEGGQFLNGDAGQEVFVEWENNAPSGKLFAKAIPNEGICEFNYELIVHIKDTLAPPKSYPVFIDAARKLIACTDVNCSFYRWWKVVDNNQINIGETEKPYLIYDAGAKSNEVFYVETFYRKDDVCSTWSYPCNSENEWNSGICGLIKSEFLPDGFEEKVDFCISADNVTLKTGLNRTYTLEIYDLTGRPVYNDKFTHEKTLTRNLFKPGTYIFIVQSENRIRAKKLLGL